MLLLYSTEFPPLFPGQLLRIPFHVYSTPFRIKEMDEIDYFQHSTNPFAWYNLWGHWEWPIMSQNMIVVHVTMWRLETLLPRRISQSLCALLAPKDVYTNENNENSAMENLNVLLTTFINHRYYYYTYLVLDDRANPMNIRLCKTNCLNLNWKRCRVLTR